MQSIFLTTLPCNISVLIAFNKTFGVRSFYGLESDSEMMA